MNILELIRADRRLPLFALTSVLAIVLGFFTFSPGSALAILTAGGYWAMLGTAAWFAWSLWRLAQESKPWADLREPVGWVIPAFILGCGLILLVHETYGFKILMDEVMLLGTSMGMHFDKHPLVPVRGHDLQGAFQLLDGLLDKRPIFQPFLVSILHDLTGYRPENIFALNTALTFVLLGLVYAAARKLAGREAGILAVLLLTSLPLLAQNATGGGFELLNLVMIMSTLLLGMRFAERRDPGSLQALLLSTALLAQTRYESILFLLPVGLLVCVLAEINLSKHSEKNAVDFEKEVAACPQITECYSTTGSADYMIKVVTTDIKAYETFMHKVLFKLPGVEHVRSSIVLRELKCDPRMPLD